MTSTITFDDRSPFIHYSPGWRQKGKKGVEFDGTTMGTNTPGANATLVFNGTTISVFGTVQSDDMDQSQHIPTPTSSYSIDGGGQTVFTPANIFQNTTQYNVTFFQATGLALNVSHTLVITMQNKGSLFLDWIQVGSSLEFPAGVPTTNSTSSDAPHSMPDMHDNGSHPHGTGDGSSNSHGGDKNNGGHGGGNDSSTSNSIAHQSTTTHSTSTGEIIAIVLGATSFLIILCGIFFFLGKRQRAKRLRQRELLDRETKTETMVSSRGSRSHSYHIGDYPKKLEEGYRGHPQQPQPDTSKFLIFRQCCG
ncbi:hypothetical protein CPC08DRAFT_478134 [Agrocybe pediades]|nr:hypothetical protein CPC08DRAFT_478134 [Agrocybe pediades]